MNAPRIQTALLTILLVLVAATGCADRFNSSVTEAYLLAHNEHSAESMSALFHEDAQLIGPDGTVIEGQQALEEISEWYAAVQSRLTAEIVSSENDEVTLGPLVQESEMLSRFGIDRIEMEPGTVFKFRGGLIESVRIAPMTEASEQSMAERFGPFFAWARLNRPEVAAPLEETPPRLNAETAKALLTALDEWKATQTQ